MNNVKRIIFISIMIVITGGLGLYSNKYIYDRGVVVDTYNYGKVLVYNDNVYKVASSNSIIPYISLDEIGNIHPSIQVTKYNTPFLVKNFRTIFWTTWIVVYFIVMGWTIWDWLNKVLPSSKKVIFVDEDDEDYEDRYNYNVSNEVITMAKNDIVVEKEKLLNLKYDDRKYLVKKGKYLDVFIKDSDYGIRKLVAEHGYRLDILVNDEDDYVRTEVARQGYGLAKLVNDKDIFVRKEVAKHGYGLEILVNDESKYVRYEVAKQDYGLDILIDDENDQIRQIARTRLNKLARLDRLNKLNELKQVKDVI